MWTQFWDMHSGGRQKLEWHYIYIEAPRDVATVVFYNRFGRNPERVTCTCCGEDYAIDEAGSLARLTGYHRNCDVLETPRVNGLYKQPDDPWFTEHYYLEPEDVAEAKRRGYKVKENFYKEYARKHRERLDAQHCYMTVAKYCKRSDVLVIHAADIKPEERVGEVPEQGYVWRD